MVKLGNKQNSEPLCWMVNKAVYDTWDQRAKTVILCSSRCEMNHRNTIAVLRLF